MKMADLSSDGPSIKERRGSMERKEERSDALVKYLECCSISRKNEDNFNSDFILLIWLKPCKLYTELSVP